MQQRSPHSVADHATRDHPTSPSPSRILLLALAVIAIGALLVSIAPGARAQDDPDSSSLISQPRTTPDPSDEPAPDRHDRLEWAQNERTAEPWTPTGETQNVRILGIGEFSGALQRPVGFQGELRDGSGNVRPAGGGPHMAATIGKLRDQAGDSLLLATGDSIGGTTPEAALLGDRPTIEFFNRLGVDGAAVGRRELAAGPDHLRSLVRPECRGQSDCRFDPPLPPFHGAAFPFLASNAIPSPEAAPTFPFAIHRVGEARVGVIAVTLPDEHAPETTTRLSDPARAVSETVDALQFLGVEAIVGVVQANTVHSNLDPAECPEELTDLELVQNLDPAVDALVVGASGGPATCRTLDSANDERVVVAPASHGRSVTVVDLAIDPATGDVVRPQSSAFNQTVNLDIDPDPATVDFVRRAEAAAAPPSREQIGTAVETVGIEMDADGEAPLSNLVADAQLAATRDHGADLALSNPDSLRTPLPQGPLDYETLHSVQPYGDRLYLVSLTGAELQAAFDMYADDIGATGPAVSENVRYTVDPARPEGSRVTELRIDDEPVDPDRDYTVVVNEFLASPEWGQSPIVEHGHRRAAGLTDLDALVSYVREQGPVRAPDPGRVTVLD